MINTMHGGVSAPNACTRASESGFNIATQRAYYMGKFLSIPNVGAMVSVFEGIMLARKDYWYERLLT